MWLPSSRAAATSSGRLAGAARLVASPVSAPSRRSAICVPRRLPWPRYVVTHSDSTVRCCVAGRALERRASLGALQPVQVDHLCLGERRRARNRRDAAVTDRQRAGGSAGPERRKRLAVTG